jgi:transposase
MTELMRLGILPTGWICPPGDRALRDLLRRRLLIVNSRTRQLLSLGSMFSRQTGLGFTSRQIEKLAPEFLHDLLGDDNLTAVAKEQLELMRSHCRAIEAMERLALQQCRSRPEYGLLSTVPGIGKILAMTIMLEIGSISRFRGPGNLSSYCRAVTAKRTSNGKVKGTNNRRNGNRYLSWAFVEAVNHAIRVFPPARKWYQRKKAKTNAFVARKALCSKWSKAVWYILTERKPFNPVKVFG